MSALWLNGGIAPRIVALSSFAIGLFPAIGFAAAFPNQPPPIGTLLAGFGVMAAGLVALTYRRSHAPLRSGAGTLRVATIIAIYAVCSTWFMRVIAPAVLGVDRSPWLEALADVLCVTLGLFVWVVALADRYTARDFGLHGSSVRRLALTTAMGLGAVAACGFGSLRRIVGGDADLSVDHLVFALVFAVLGSAIPEELLFRGLLTTSLNGRTRRWLRVVAPALAFTVIRGLRWIPGTDLPAPVWMEWLLGTVLPLGLWWGLMRDLAGGSLWPGLVSHILIEFGTRLAGSPIYGRPAS
ncbi:MAG TPA: CPBP family intramembrane glutamic endopeptidase [Thermoanaerobaculia bacterium]